MRICILSALTLALAFGSFAPCSGGEKDDAKRMKALAADLRDKDAQVRMKIGRAHV